MAEEEQAQEKTEQPSPKRLKESRDKGQVARSKDLNAMVILLFTGIGFWFIGERLSLALADIMRGAFRFDISFLRLPNYALQSLYQLSLQAVLALLPVLGLILLLSFLAPLLMGGWVFSTQAFQPQFSRLSPLKGFKRMVSLKSLVEMVKAFAKFVLIAAVAITVLYGYLPALLALAEYPLATAVGSGLLILIQSFIIISASLVIIAFIDVPFQIYEHQKQLKMTKQELKDEFKETEGKPEVKAQVRRRQQEISRRRMMSEVPKATVILTNPTHYAVAIHYQQNGTRAPYLLAKGQDQVALQIARVAREHQVPVLSLPPLARAIYFSTELNAEIPRGLYVAVAQVLAYIFQLGDPQNYEVQPERLRDLPIPDDLQNKNGDIA
ncbi:MAG: flagellar biosynthesis protein FlhB [Legionellaceae bacterium]|nr:flagellar biosynthesis protein FlhB [Legionellaceae bacterium]